MKKYSKREALKLIRRIVQEGKVILSKHARQRMQERKVTVEDILFIVKNGIINTEPEIHIKTGRWTYRVEGKDLDERSIHLLVDIYEEDVIIIVLTVIT